MVHKRTDVRGLMYPSSEGKGSHSRRGVFHPRLLLLLLPPSSRCLARHRWRLRTSPTDIKSPNHPSPAKNKNSTLMGRAVNVLVPSSSRSGGGGGASDCGGWSLFLRNGDEPATTSQGHVSPLGRKTRTEEGIKHEEREAEEVLIGGERKRRGDKRCMPGTRLCQSAWGKRGLASCSFHCDDITPCHVSTKTGPCKLSRHRTTLLKSSGFRSLPPSLHPQHTHSRQDRAKASECQHSTQLNSNVAVCSPLSQQKSCTHKTHTPHSPAAGADTAAAARTA